MLKLMEVETCGLHKRNSGSDVSRWPDSPCPVRTTEHPAQPAKNPPQVIDQKTKYSNQNKEKDSHCHVAPRPGFPWILTGQTPCAIDHKTTIVIMHGNKKTAVVYQ